MKEFAPRPWGEDGFPIQLFVIRPSLPRYGASYTRCLGVYRYQCSDYWQILHPAFDVRAAKDYDRGPRFFDSCEGRGENVRRHYE